jgi:hypothetical protein
MMEDGIATENLPHHEHSTDEVLLAAITIARRHALVPLYEEQNEHLFLADALLAMNEAVMVVMDVELGLAHAAMTLFGQVGLVHVRRQDPGPDHEEGHILLIQGIHVVAVGALYTHGRAGAVVVAGTIFGTAGQGLH